MLASWETTAADDSSLLTPSEATSQLQPDGTSGKAGAWMIEGAGSGSGASLELEC